jgi:BASS family bile acid:Na+ symporter
MGLTLSFADYRQLAHMPRALAIGLVAQFAIMPLTGFAIAQAIASRSRRRWGCNKGWRSG